MNNHIYANVRAVYHEGVLTILDPLPLPDGAQVQLDIHIQDDTPARRERGRYPTILVPAAALAPLIESIEMGGDALADSEGIYDFDQEVLLLSVS
jgi:hypothetical protein